MKLQAAYRLMAAKADEKQAKVFLESLGFTGLQPKLSSEDRISFKYSGMDRKFLDKHFGQPKPTGRTDLYWKFGLDGNIILKESTRIVVLKNSQRNSKNFKGVETHVPPEVEKKAKPPVAKPPKVKEPPKLKPGVNDFDPEDDVPPKFNPKDSPNNPGSKENDDSQVPVTHIPEQLQKMYRFCQTNDDRTYRLSFNKRLWDFLNETKFGGKMKQPYLGLLKMQAAGKMRLRGYWMAMRRQLSVSPRLYNASQNFFVEIFLHEMCHQAVSEIDRVVDRTAQGHGPNWITWMRKVGLNPRRFDPNDNSTYMTDDEKDEHERKKEERQQKREIVQEQIKDQGLKRMWRVDDPCLATVNWDNKITHCLIVCPTGQNRQKYAAFDRSYLHSERFQLVPAEAIFQWAGSDEDKALLLGESGKRKEMRIRSYYNQKSERRSQKRELRRMFNNW